MSRTYSRRYRKASGRRVWVFSDLNYDLRPEQIARIIASTALQAAREQKPVDSPESGSTNLTANEETDDASV
jgi:hypothetical protein